MERARGRPTVGNLTTAGKAQTHRTSSASYRRTVGSPALTTDVADLLLRSVETSTKHHRTELAHKPGDSAAVKRAKTGATAAMQRDLDKTRKAHGELVSSMSTPSATGTQRRTAREQFAKQLERNTTNVPGFGDQDGNNLVSDDPQFRLAKDGRPASPGSETARALATHPKMVAMAGKPTIVVNKDGRHMTADGNLVKPNPVSFAGFEKRVATNAATKASSDAPALPETGLDPFAL